ncbi:MAG: amylo-alpha-1,6-glucosidase [Candidatus Saccharimonadales bacterium]
MNIDIIPDLHLRPYETIKSVVMPPARKLTHLPSSLEQFLRLTRATTTAEIGKNGPSIASLSFETDQPSPDNLRLYEVEFGRDALRVAIEPEILQSYPNLAKNTILSLARLQGLTYNQSREEEPGRIVHEVRDKNDPIARDLSQRLGWGWPYYGSVDATPEFIRTMAAYCKLSPENRQFLFQSYEDKNGTSRIMADSLTFAVDWISNRLNANPEGLLEFKSVLPKGIENQVWKDSWDAYHHSDGTLANHRKGIASIEVQVSTYDALLEAADLYDILNRTDAATKLRVRAASLRQTIFDIFWTDDKGGYFVLGTDRDGNNKLRPMNIRTSNMGHALDSRILEGDDPDVIDKRHKIVNQLLSPEMLNVSGIRTLASDEILYRPGAYHNGSVWTFDTHKIALGMYRHGFTTQATQLDDCSLNVVVSTHAFPEYTRGDHAPIPRTNKYIIDLYDTRAGRINRIEQPPQEVQAWTVAAILAIKIRRGRDAHELLHLK